MHSEVCQEWGADLLRLWVASQDYQTDLRMSDRMMGQLADAYRKLRNTFRWALGNLGDFDPARDSVADADLWELDRWMLARTAELAERSRGWYEAFEFQRVFHTVQDFAVVGLSAFYFDILKDRMYTFAPASPGRRSAQTAVWRIAHALVRLLAPFLVFTAEEIWKQLPRRPGDPESVHMAMFPASGEFGAPPDARLGANWERLVALREQVLRALERARNEKLIAGSLEAKVRLAASDGWRDLLEGYRAWLPAVFLVSQVEVAPARPGNGAGSEALDGLGIEIQRAEGGKCERCWNYSPAVGTFPDFPTVCDRCFAALGEILGSGGNGKSG